MKEGHGIMTLPDGSTYEGEFKNNQIEGYGHFRWMNGK